LAGANLAGAEIINIIQCSGIGSNRRITLAVILAEKIAIQCGCFRGTFAEFAAKIEQTHASNPQYLEEYRATLAWIQACADACRGKVVIA
jgi:hypothetical protein